MPGNDLQAVQQLQHSIPADENFILCRWPLGSAEVELVPAIASGEAFLKKVDLHGYAVLSTSILNQTG
jgi:hypothetical protein